MGNRVFFKRSILLVVLLVVVACGANAQTVKLDYFFNREVHNVNGQPVRFHYLWDEQENTGFSIFGNAFKKQGATLDSLATAPTEANLKGTAIYIIVDPDTKKESPKPNYITATGAGAIAAWVKQGGVLVMMANDSANVELPHFNLLAEKFGMHFNNDLQNHVIDDNHFEDGALNTKGNFLFKTACKIFMKDVCSISVIGKAKAALSKNGYAIIATAKYGKGTVLAVGDPWLYNEYTNGRLPASFENDKAANDIADWLLKQVPVTK
ncbi:hypothetical protein [Mucilaginibacter sp. SP1R1]|uniref:hypothetical protein n=1 Tax=Mucilaginibacter sp. SP1R1 TaxID=2723091 RepID=UPI00160C663B|nr:hypothetical protein [Mucilaginibacter sp. SP1R1]MBB6147643.1 unsaturated rhamnogalacturonyl hydrolase [Mucilaginibacter sp. SP1R1]